MYTFPFVYMRLSLINSLASNGSNSGALHELPGRWFHRFSLGWLGWLIWVRSLAMHGLHERPRHRRSHSNAHARHVHSGSDTHTRTRTKTHKHMHTQTHTHAHARARAHAHARARATCPHNLTRAYKAISLLDNRPIPQLPALLELAALVGLAVP
jgi:hypothetical protein